MKGLSFHVDIEGDSFELIIALFDFFGGISRSFPFIGLCFPWGALGFFVNWDNGVRRLFDPPTRVNVGISGCKTIEKDVRTGAILSRSL